MDVLARLTEILSTNPYAVQFFRCVTLQAMCNISSEMFYRHVDFPIHETHVCPVDRDDALPFLCRYCYETHAIRAPTDSYRLSSSILVPMWRTDRSQLAMAAKYLDMNDARI